MDHNIVQDTLMDHNIVQDTLMDHNIVQETLMDHNIVQETLMDHNTRWTCMIYLNISHILSLILILFPILIYPMILTLITLVDP